MVSLSPDPLPLTPLPGTLLNPQSRNEETASGANSTGDQAMPRVSATAAPIAQASQSPGGAPLIPAILVVQGADCYQAFAYLLTRRGTARSWGHGVETRYEEIWRGGGEKGMLLEKVKHERPGALERAVGAAWRVACSQIESSEQPEPNWGLDKELLQGDEIPDSLFMSAAWTNVDGAASLASNDGNPVLLAPGGGPIQVAST